MRTRVKQNRKGKTMTGNFGKFIEKKRKEKSITLRGLASMLSIAPAYMSDIEKGHRYPPDKEKLEAMAEILELSEEEKNNMYDLAAGEKENTVSLDLSEYIMKNDKVRIALRMARDNNLGNETWQKMIDVLKKEIDKKEGSETL